MKKTLLMMFGTFLKLNQLVILNIVSSSLFSLQVEGNGWCISHPGSSQEAYCTRCREVLQEIRNFLIFKDLLHFLPVDQGKLLNDLNDNFMVKRELRVIGGGSSLNCGRYMAIASAALLSAKKVRVPDQ